MLSIQYPIRYHEHFEDYSDFTTIDGTQFEKWLFETQRYNVPSGKSIILDASQLTRDAMLECLSQVAAGRVISPMSENPDLHIVDVTLCTEFLNQRGILTIGYWQGERRHMEMLNYACDMVAIPYIRPRGVYIEPEEADGFYFYEFCNLDELRRMKPRMMHTSLPITAAAFGIDLATRERRPKKLPAFKYDMLLTVPQIELAKHNIRLIREAFESTE